ncbi:hypothetical protein ACTL6P_09965 [Endozoicomonas acroporae]|uniref:hypothetical protein n=1 Tax=Endozoicomonas acroporae TaxID=1701104 RepID=UPI0011AF9C4D|nr:hypothetical protein [Endozoicomonas acroporae]
MNLSPVKSSELTSPHSAAFLSEPSSIYDNYHSSQVFIPRRDQQFDMQRLLSSRKVVKNDPSIQFHFGHIGKNFPIWLRVPSDKPENTFWTSTLKKETATEEEETATEETKTEKNTTAWIEWCRNSGMHIFLGKTAAQFQVSETANIFHIDSYEKYEHLLKEYPHSGNDDFIDWERVAIDFDAVHCAQGFDLPGWSCESTAWFNRDKLVFLKSLNSQEIDL